MSLVLLLITFDICRQSAEKKRPGSAGPSRPGSAASRPGSAANRPGSGQGMRPSGSNQVNWMVSGRDVCYITLSIK